MLLICDSLSCEHPKQNSFNCISYSYENNNHLFHELHLQQYYYSNKTEIETIEIILEFFLNIVLTGDITNLADEGRLLMSYYST